MNYLWISLVLSSLLCLHTSLSFATKVHIIEEGDELHLNCHRAGKQSWTYCLWSHNSENATYLTRSNGNANEENSLMFFPGFESRLKVNANKENCSIVILNSSHTLDTGYWSCSLSTFGLDLDHHDEVDVHVLARPKIKLSLKQRDEDGKETIWKNPSELVVGFEYLVDVTLEMPEDDTVTFNILTTDISSTFEINSKDEKLISEPLQEVRGMVVDFKTNSFQKQFIYEPSLREATLFKEMRENGYVAAIRCSVSQMIEYPDNSDFHEKVIENDALIIIDEFFIAESNVFEVSKDEEMENENETLPDAQIYSSGFRPRDTVQQQIGKAETGNEMILVYVLVPFVILVLVTIALFLACCAYRHGWWCFETNSSSGYCTVSTQSSTVATDFDNNYKTSKYVDTIEKSSTLTNNMMLSNSQNDVNHVYEEIPNDLDRAASLDRLYDTLDFQRPMAAHLCPHYQSTKMILADEQTSSQIGEQQPNSFQLGLPTSNDQNIVRNESYV